MEPEVIRGWMLWLNRGQLDRDRGSTDLGWCWRYLLLVRLLIDWKKLFPKDLLLPRNEASWFSMLRMASSVAVSIVLRGRLEPRYTEISSATWHRTVELLGKELLPGCA